MHVWRIFHFEDMKNEGLAKHMHEIFSLEQAFPNDDAHILTGIFYPSW